MAGRDSTRANGVERRQADNKRPPRGGHCVFVLLTGLIGGRQDLRLLQFHRDAAALDLALTGLDAEDLGAARRTLESFAQLVRHDRLPL
jgi:hypothetical protein